MHPALYTNLIRRLFIWFAGRARGAVGGDLPSPSREQTSAADEDSIHNQYISQFS